MIINENTVIAEVTRYSVTEFTEKHIATNAFIEVHAFIDKSLTVENEEEVSFFAIPVDRVIHSMSKNPEAKQFGKTKEEALNKVLNWLEGKTRDEVFPRKETADTN